MNSVNQGVNAAIGCGVHECRFNKSGEYCSLEKIHVGTNCTCSTESERCTCCDNYEHK